MNRCQHGYMNGYSENLRRKVLSAVGRGMPKAQAARTFDVSLPSLRRYVDKAERGEPLAPKKSPGSPPKLDEKTRKLLEDDLRERPFATLRERCDYVALLGGISLSRSTMWSAIAPASAPRAKRGTGSHRARRVLKGGLASEGGRGGGAREAHLRRRARDAYLIGTDLRLRAKRKASASEGAQGPRQEHHAAF
jgi:transposase